MGNANDEEKRELLRRVDKRRETVSQELPTWGGKNHLLEKEETSERAGKRYLAKKKCRS